MSVFIVSQRLWELSSPRPRPRGPGSAGALGGRHPSPAEAGSPRPSPACGARPRGRSGWERAGAALPAAARPCPRSCSAVTGGTPSKGQEQAGQPGAEAEALGLQGVLSLLLLCLCYSVCAPVTRTARTARDAREPGRCAGDCRVFGRAPWLSGSAPGKPSPSGAPARGPGSGNVLLVETVSQLGGRGSSLNEARGSFRTF